ncbi:hypothetical protein WICPIJ_006126 [Wickerhamomyces pijperi]|uniref:Uncharacterized protein n=1 Tax=Wickerhamomyces pijperi TaxID=599730 RepID=A0A9P8TLP8_WICPI|nr:hypothetical protein WICPIJ_006126 [Wickerhamomyces pijperi]
MLGSELPGTAGLLEASRVLNACKLDGLLWVAEYHWLTFSNTFGVQYLSFTQGGRNSKEAEMTPCETCLLFWDLSEEPKLPDEMDDFT